MKARKRPVKVFAIQYKNDSNLVALLDLLKRDAKETVHYDKDTKIIYLKKDKGDLALRKGNWAIYENKEDGFYPIENDIFKETYTLIPNTVNYFRKNVYEVNCVEFKDLKRMSILKVLLFLGYGFFGSILNISRVQEKGYIIIDTLEGKAKLFPSEILVKGIKGEYYPVKRKSFNKIYEIIK